MLRNNLKNSGRKEENAMKSAEKGKRELNRKLCKEPDRNRNKECEKEYDFESTIRAYLKQGREKLIKDLTGTREAIKLIANDRTRDFMLVTDRGLNKEERDYLIEVIVSSMYQTFCYGYGIGKIEGSTNNKIYL